MVNSHVAAAHMCVWTQKCWATALTKDATLTSLVIWEMVGVTVVHSIRKGVRGMAEIVVKRRALMTRICAALRVTIARTLHTV